MAAADAVEDLRVSLGLPGRYGMLACLKRV